MKFVKNNELKEGMRLAKPIYNKKGVLLYDRNSKLTQAAIDSVENFGLMGLFILEPAEPLPPMTQEDIEFERFQTVCVFQIKDELENILTKSKAAKVQFITDDILRHYGRLSKKVNFVQNLRSKEDYVYKHSLNCAMLCAMIAHAMNIKLDEQNDSVMAAIVHDIGKLTVSKELKDKGTALEGDELRQMKAAEKGGVRIIEGVFTSKPSIKRIVSQCQNALDSFREGKEINLAKMVNPAKVLMVAEIYDTMTAMNDIKEPASEIEALRFLQTNPQAFAPKAVEALVKSINFLTNGCCVELNNGDKGLVIAANDENVLCPMVLCFGTNAIVDLQRDGMGLEIKDIMKTMDNRCVIDKEAMNNYIKG